MSNEGSAIVNAKIEFTSNLTTLLSPLIYEGFVTIWENCKNETLALKKFQDQICLIPKWNQDILDLEYSRIVNKTENQYIDKLIEAVFLSNVKVLSSIRIGKTKTVNVPVPNTKNFIHKCYIESARKLWQDPHLIDDRESLSHVEIKKNIKRLNTMIVMCIENTIRDMIPISTILESYLNDIESDEENDPEPFPDEINKENLEEIKSESNESLQPEENRNEDFFMTEPEHNNNENNNYNNNENNNYNNDENKNYNNNENNNYNNNKNYNNNNNKNNYNYNFIIYNNNNKNINSNNIKYNYNYNYNYNDLFQFQL